MKTFDDIWIDKYRAGHGQKAPWDAVVSFIFRYRPRDLDITDTKIYEVGCGTCGNLIFAAEQGFKVFGIDASRDAIENARTLFSKKGLSADLLTGDFSEQNFPERNFDLIVDRAALTCTSTENLKSAIQTVHKMLKTGGKFLFTPYASDHSSIEGAKCISHNLYDDIKQGSLKGVGQIRFFSGSEIPEFFDEKLWDVISQVYISEECMMTELRHTHWRIILEKK
ncbi:MAG: class I SAM-dependent methyltransferase [Lentisphaeraceae bacterium]|nr:class I SAM-dependent methyltransferase [Lentisphaeraceae bacterium]